MSRKTKMASLYPRSPPVPDPRPDQTTGWLTRARRSSVATMPHAQARQAESPASIRGLAPTSTSVARLQTFGHLIDASVTDMCEVGKPPRREPRPPRSQRSSVILGRNGSVTSTGPSLIDYGKMRAELGEARLAD